MSDAVWVFAVLWCGRTHTCSMVLAASFAILGDGGGGGWWSKCTEFSGDFPCSIIDNHLIVF